MEKQHVKIEISTSLSIPQDRKELDNTSRNIMTTNSKPSATIKSLDHLVLTVKSVEKTIEWYTKNLGMESQSFESVANPGVKRYSLVFGQQKINLHQLGKVR